MTETTGAGEPLWEPTLADVWAARARLAAELPETPLVASPRLGARLGASVHLKCENLQPTGAFKVRGGLNLVAVEVARGAIGAAGVVAASTGNHGQSLAFAARRHRIRARIFAPCQANPAKVEAMRSLGAEVCLVGEDFDEAREAAEEEAARSGARYVHSMNEPLLIAGVATAALECFLAMPDIDVLVVPIGGGSGASGAGLVAKALKPSCRVIGVQAEGAPAVYRSFHSGRLERTAAAHTLAEGLATRVAFELPLTLLRRFVDDVVLVSDEEMLVAQRLFLEEAHLVAEAAAAATLAACLRLAADLAGRRVVLMVSGGNVTRAQLEAALASAGPPL